MKKFILYTFVAGCLAITACNNNSNEKKEDKTEAGTTPAIVYTCPMHPEVTSDGPGTCPKCNMDLVKKE
jgi:hypothetical protein